MNISMNIHAWVAYGIVCTKQQTLRADPPDAIRNGAIAENSGPGKIQIQVGAGIHQRQKLLEVRPLIRMGRDKCYIRVAANHNGNPGIGTGDRIISGVHFSDNKVYINRTQYFSNVREDLWDFCFAGYHGLQKWFKDRRQSTISDAEIQHVITVFNVFDQSENHMEQLDEVLAAYEII